MKKALDNQTQPQNNKQSQVQQLESKGQISYISLSPDDTKILGKGKNQQKNNNIKYLLELKDVFSRQLPKMPKQYILKMVLDNQHECLAVLDKQENKIIGGVCFRQFSERGFAQLVFLAVQISHQIKGFGTRLMNQFKNLMQARKIQFIITFADNLAIGYFKKQGFSKNFKADKNRWKGYIKDYEGGTMMECLIYKQTDYLNMPKYINDLVSFVRNEIKSKAFKKYEYQNQKVSEYDYFRPQSSQAQKFPFNPIQLAKQSGWSWQQHEKLRKQPTIKLLQEMRRIINEMKDHTSSWPFRQPVPSIETEYYEYIENPMDISTISLKLKQKKYLRHQDFTADVMLIFNNCKLFNHPETVFFKAADSLEKFIVPKLEKLKEAQ